MISSNPSTAQKVTPYSAGSASPAPAKSAAKGKATETVIETLNSPGVQAAAVAEAGVSSRLLTTKGS